MKRLLYVFFPIFLVGLLSCNKIQKDSKDNSSDLNIDNSDLNQMIKIGVLKHNEIMDLDSSYTLVIEFTKNCLPQFTSNDTVILIYYMHNNKGSLGYKGIMKIDNCDIAIFDEYNVGSKYYHKNKLLSTPLDSLFCYNEDIIDVLVFKLQNGEVIEWSTNFVD